MGKIAQRNHSSFMAALTTLNVGYFMMEMVRLATVPEEDDDDDDANYDDDDDDDDADDDDDDDDGDDNYDDGDGDDDDHDDDDDDSRQIYMSEAAESHVKQYEGMKFKSHYCQ